MKLRKNYEGKWKAGAKDRTTVGHWSYHQEVAKDSERNSRERKPAK